VAPIKLGFEGGSFEGGWERSHGGAVAGRWVVPEEWSDHRGHGLTMVGHVTPSP
jgi:hypothetical protein